MRAFESLDLEWKKLLLAGCTPSLSRPEMLRPRLVSDAASPLVCPEMELFRPVPLSAGKAACSTAGDCGAAAEASFLRPPKKLSRAPRPWRKETGWTMETSSPPSLVDGGLAACARRGVGVLVSLVDGGERGHVGELELMVAEAASRTACGGVKNAISGAKVASKSVHFVLVQLSFINKMAQKCSRTTYASEDRPVSA
jgi:hypothetical protein